METGQQQIRSLVTADGFVEVSLVSAPVPEPGPDEVVVRMEAAPINPSDLGLLLAGADLGTATEGGTPDSPSVRAKLPAAAALVAQARAGQSLPVGNEGAGTVVAAGPAPAAQALIGRTVAVAGGSTYARFRAAHVAQCLVLPEGTDAVDGASTYVNPMTVLGMVETMQREGHTALVHTAAASKLGQMLNRLCIEDGIPLVNIVRSAEQEALLRAAGATYVCNSAFPGFERDLTAALTATKATLAFDAVGGGLLASQILTAMEAAAVAAADGAFSRYGSTVHKQVYLYGGLDRGPTQLNRAFGMAWGIGGWLLPPFLEKIGPERTRALRERVAAGLHDVFATTYAEQVTLAGALQLDAMRRYALQATGGKFLIRPQL